MPCEIFSAPIHQEKCQGLVQDDCSMQNVLFLGTIQVIPSVNLFAIILYFRCCLKDVLSLHGLTQKGGSIFSSCRKEGLML